MTKANAWQLANSVVAVLALVVSVVGLLTTRQLQGGAVVSMVSYSSDYSPKVQQAEYLVTVGLRNEGPAIASDVVFGLTGLDGTALPASWRSGAIGVQETVQGTVIVNVATNLMGLTGDPTTALRVWASYKDGLGESVNVKFPPAALHQTASVSQAEHV